MSACVVELWASCWLLPSRQVETAMRGHMSVISKSMLRKAPTITQQVVSARG